MTSNNNNDSNNNGNNDSNDSNDSNSNSNMDNDNPSASDAPEEEPTRARAVVVQHVHLDPNNNNNNNNAQPLPLDWTQMGSGGGGVGGSNSKPIALRFPADVVADIQQMTVEDPTELCIVGTAGQKITHIGTDFSSTVAPPQLQKLILRSHIIRTIEGLDCFTALELLELYDNQVEALEGLDAGTGGLPGITLKVLDMSYNVIRDMQPVSLCPNLVELCKCAALR